MTLLIGAWTVGLILSLLALGVFISFRVFKFPHHVRCEGEARRSPRDAPRLASASHEFGRTAATLERSERGYVSCRTPATRRADG